MQSLQKIRRYEFILIIFITVIYVIRRLFQEASKFDSMITAAELNKVPSNIIWGSLRAYDHIGNNNFPTIVAALLFLVAWLFFHYLVFPRLQEKKFDSTTFTFIAIVIILCISSVQIFEYLKLYIRFKHDSNQNIIGLKVYSQYRKLLVVTNSIAVLITILFYEAFSQFYYFIHKKLKDEKEVNFQYLDYFLIATISISMIFVALFGNILSGKGYWYGAVRDLSLLAVGAITIFFAQDAFYKRVLPYFSSVKSIEFQKGLTYFVFINLFGAIGGYFIQMLSWLSYNYVYFGFHSEWIIQLFMIFVVISIVIAFLRKVFYKEKIELKTQIISKSAELLNLRSQINPHFLFNALNTLYSVSLKENAEKTSDGIQKLGDMMRFMLNENHQDRIPLSKEIEYLHNYIDIQRMRIDENHNIEIKVNIQNSERDIFISPMLLNPFVENAFKHGISFRNPSWIYITLTHDAQKLYFKVHNSLHPKQENSPEQANNGIGLENVKKRLELIYPNRHTLDIQVSDNDYFVSLIIGIY
ncbi:MAG: sensor histidine kinase [Emticicia sp.]|uniref:sensor histidine kinase n=1 Tax=Emticicia sp. TaxID=1930953 RepID=UPI003BA80B2A